MKNPVLAKGAALLLVLACLAYGLFSIGDIVYERHGNQRTAEMNVERDQVGKQTLMGPVLQRHCTEEWQTWEGEGTARKLRNERRGFILTAPPGTLRIDAQVDQDPRYRGIFRIDTYAAKTRLKAQWPASDAMLPPRSEHADGRVQCEAPSLVVALMDARGIRSAHATVNGNEVSIQPGTQHPSYQRGFHMPLDETAAGRELNVEVSLELLGTGQISFAPVAESTQVKMNADWPHPSFGGRFLPAERTVTDQGFEATWRVFSLATTAPADYGRGVPLCANDMRQEYGPEPGTCVESFGVAFFDPVNPYSLSSRAVKYGMLFVGLTFIAVGMLELLRRLRVHPMQYLLVGCALSIFFLLLLSLSEHMPFGWAYACASLACSLLLAVYVSYAMGGKRTGMGFGVGVAGLYGALYVVLQSEQAALMMGSLLLFAVLAAVMLATRKLDWYGVLGSDKTAQKPANPPAP
ncbi:Inner membrane protein CreD [Bordetella ansorpii]|uniref:Inner membrane protein CreD n=1 Tax=Bordetella ansorpii TaxID=288768 RepID=A0A157SAJ4_9BORD|nr:cell envelope integrity protein CreD [Bordetella ansorpii]SAI67438.1 Inner membrane protein CreD [Bordetella ansorpii]